MNRADWRSELYFSLDACENHKRNIAEKIRKQLEDAWEQEKRILAVYNFSGKIENADLLFFLLTANARRLELACDCMDIAIVIAVSGESPEKTASSRFYLQNMATETLRLFKSAGNIFIFDDYDFFICAYEQIKAEYFSVYPENYNPASSRKRSGNRLSSRCTYPFLEAPDDQVKLVRKWLCSRVYPNIPVTITLGSGYGQDELSGWRKLIEYYHGSNVKFIVITDNSDIYDEKFLCGSNIVYWGEAVISLSLRAALYQEAVLNLFPNGKSALLAVFNKSAHSVIMDKSGGKFPFATGEQVISVPDLHQSMVSRIDMILNNLNQSSSLLPEYYHA